MNLAATDLSGDLPLLPEKVMLPDGAVDGHAAAIVAGRFAAVGPAEQMVADYPYLRQLALPICCSAPASSTPGTSPTVSTMR